MVAAWSADDRHRLAELLSPDLFGEWARRLDELRRRRCTNPLRRRGRIVFRDTDDSGRHTHSEYWTLGRCPGRRVLVSVETEQEGAHHLTDPIVGGSRRRDSTFAVVWQLHLIDDPETPWRIASIARPAERRRSVLYRFTIKLTNEILIALLPGRRTFL